MAMGYTVIAVIGGAISVIAGLVFHLSVLHLLAVVVLSASASVLGIALLNSFRIAGWSTGPVQQNPIRPS
jgi:hypothetical protein